MRPSWCTCIWVASARWGASMSWLSLSSCSIWRVFHFYTILMYLGVLSRAGQHSACQFWPLSIWINIAGTKSCYIWFCCPMNTTNSTPDTKDQWFNHHKQMLELHRPKDVRWPWVISCWELLALSGNFKVNLELIKLLAGRRVQLFGTLWVYMSQWHVHVYIPTYCRPSFRIEGRAKRDRQLPLLEVNSSAATMAMPGLWRSLSQKGEDVIERLSIQMV